MGGNQSKQPLYTLRHWGKSDRENHQSIHLLEHHSADVAACFEALLGIPTISNRLSKAGRLENIDAVTCARLSVFAALHDVGKANLGFQTKIWSLKDFPGRHSPCSTAGHIQELSPILRMDDHKTAAWFFDALGWEEICTWDDKDGEVVSDLLVAMLSHHGKPLELQNEMNPNPRIWELFGLLDPHSCIKNLGRFVHSWFPRAFSNQGEPFLPSAPAFQHMFLGLCNLADWIGSDENIFEFCNFPREDYIEEAREKARRAMVEIGLDQTLQHQTFAGIPDFGSLFAIKGSPQPNPMQETVLEMPLQEQLIIVESETGSGKTEAALLRFAKLYDKGLVDGIYFALPTRVAASQIFKRIQRFTKSLFPNEFAPDPVLAVPGYLHAGDAKGIRLPKFEVLWDDSPDESSRRRRWAAESSKRFLAAQIATGTVDQAMMAALKVKHAHLRAACLSRNLLVIDEVHASDPYMRIILEALLNAHLEVGGYALLMSATLGSSARRRWLCGPNQEGGKAPPINDAIAAPYPAVSTRSASGESLTGVGKSGLAKAVRVEPVTAMEDFPCVARLAVNAARLGAKVLVIRNTVGHALLTQQAVESLVKKLDDETDLSHILFSCNDVHALHHGRYAAADRLVLDEAVTRQFGKNRNGGGRILVGTQTLEQSLDIDADYMVTDLCPMDVLLQRIGRLHRHTRDQRPNKYTSAQCVVLVPFRDSLAPLLSESTNGLGPEGYVYEDLRILEATRRLIAQCHEERKPWIIPEMNRELVEEAMHPSVLQSLVEELGDDWRVHSNKIEGTEIGNVQTALNWIVNRDLTFCGQNEDVVFPDIEEKVRTRLGDEGIDVTFECPMPSPLGVQAGISQVSIPGHMSRGLNCEKPIAAIQVASGFEFRIEDSGFQYDRWGLQGIHST